MWVTEATRYTISIRAGDSPTLSRRGGWGYSFKGLAFSPCAPPGNPQTPPALPCPALPCPAPHDDAGAALDGYLDGRLSLIQTRYKTVRLYPKHLSLGEKYKLKETSIFIKFEKIGFRGQQLHHVKTSCQQERCCLAAWLHPDIRMQQIIDCCLLKVIWHGGISSWSHLEQYCRH